VLFRPGLLEAPNGRGREPKQRDKRLLEIASGDALEVENRDQYLEALRSARVGRQNCRRKVNALGAFANAVTHARTAHGDRPDAGHDRQMAVTHQPPAAVFGQFVGMAAEQGATSASTASARSARAPLRKTSVSGSVKLPGWESWNTLTIGHGVSLLSWRSGGFEHPHDTPPYPFMPSPTFVHNSNNVPLHQCSHRHIGVY
jgi:hypothetical protein